MHGAASASLLMESGPTSRSGGVGFCLAGPGHDAELRRLLRDNPMAGDIRISLEREPDYFAATRIEGTEHRTIIALKGDRIVCAGGISVRQRYINGQPMRVGYLGGLRLDTSYRGRASIIRHGYEMFRQLHEQDGPPIYLTSIISDNLPARRLLERGLPGMPTYRFLGEFVTLVIRRRRNGEFFKPTSLVRGRLRKMKLSLEYGTRESLPQIERLLSETGPRYQFAPVWSLDDLATSNGQHGPNAEDFRIVLNSDLSPVACAALWDQRSVKQTVVRGYSPRLSRLRLLLNIGAKLGARPLLPAAGREISQAYVSHFAADTDQPQLCESLINMFHGPGHSRGIDYFTIGFDARDPRLPHLRKTFRPREYLSRLYAVHWDDGAELAQSIDARLLAPEVALL